MDTLAGCRCHRCFVFRKHHQWNCCYSTCCCGWNFPTDQSGKFLSTICSIRYFDLPGQPGRRRINNTSRSSIRCLLLCSKLDVLSKQASYMGGGIDSATHFYEKGCLLRPAIHPVNAHPHSAYLLPGSVSFFSPFFYK